MVRVIHQHTANTPITVSHSETDVSMGFALFQVTSLTDLAFNPSAAITTNIVDTDTGSNSFNNQRVYNGLAAGYYVLQMKGVSPIASMTLETDVYDCPSYLTNMTDYNRIFNGCIKRFDVFSNPEPFNNTYPNFYLPNLAAREVIEIQLDFINQNHVKKPINFQLLVSDSTGFSVRLNGFEMVPASGDNYKTFWTTPYAGDFFI